MPMPAARMQLLDLSEDVLYRICSNLPLLERLQLSLVCRKLRQLCAGPSELWCRVDARVKAGQPGLEGGAFMEILSGVNQFAEWLAPRGAAVEELRFIFKPPPHPAGIPLPHMLLPLIRCRAMPLLRLLSVDWGVSFVLTVYDLAGGASLPALTTLSFHRGQHLVVPELPGGQAAITSALPCLQNFGLFDSILSGALHTPWLPVTTTKLCLSNCALDALPGVLAHLPHLRSLTLDRNGHLSAASFSVLTCLTALEDLNLSENVLHSFPGQVSQLSTLKILYLHCCFCDHDLHLEPRDWEALLPLTRLKFLSISSNKLTWLPAVVAGMTQLQALHLEDNEFPALPVGPYLSNLRELLVDWKNAICCPAVLRTATQLSRLILNDHCVTVPLPPEPVPVHATRVPPAGASAEALMSALAAMPALKLVQDVLPPQDYLIMTAPVACAMWELGRRCPQLAVEYLEGTYVGWNLSDLDASVPPDPNPWR